MLTLWPSSAEIKNILFILPSDLLIYKFTEWYFLDCNAAYVSIQLAKGFPWGFVAILFISEATAKSMHIPETEKDIIVLLFFSGSNN